SRDLRGPDGFLGVSRQIRRELDRGAGARTAIRPRRRRPNNGEKSEDWYWYPMPRTALDPQRPFASARSNACPCPIADLAWRRRVVSVGRKRRPESSPPVHGSTRGPP